MEVTYQINGPLTKSRRPCLWECGGFDGQIGTSTIITRSDGKRPVLIFTDKSKAAINGNQALVLVQKGFFLIKVIHNNDKFEISVQEIEAIKVNKTDAEIKVRQTNYFINEDWRKPLPDFLNDAVEVAKKKAQDEKCIKVYYANRKK